MPRTVPGNEPGSPCVRRLLLEVLISQFHGRFDGFGTYVVHKFSSRVRTEWSLDARDDA